MINEKNEPILDFIFDDLIFYKAYSEHGYYKLTYYCVRNKEIYLIVFEDGKFILPEKLKKVSRKQ